LRAGYRDANQEKALTASESITMSPALTPVEDDLVYGLSRSAWMKIGVIAGLMGLVFWPNLRRLWLKTNPISGDPNWGHSVIVPIVGLYYLYVNREELLREPVRTAWSGLGVLLLGIMIAAYGIYPGRNDFVWDFGMVVTLFGVVLFMCGWRVMRVAWFPIAFLVCALPWPGLVYSRVAMPLQNLAAYVGVHVMSMTGVDAVQSGTKMYITNKAGVVLPLNVAEACAGMRSLMTFISVGAAVSFLSNRPFWQKVIITMSAVPIAIFCNVMRVSGQGLLHTYVSTSWSQGFAHAFAGMVMLVPGFFLILGMGWFLDQIFIEEADEGDGVQNKATVKEQQQSALVIEIPRGRNKGGV
jgi:exosortase